MKQKLIPSPNNNASVAVSAAEAYAIAYDLYPAVLLNESADVIDISSTLRSCLSKAVDRTVLISSMSDESFDCLSELCKKERSPIGAEKSDVFPLKLSRYRYGIAAKLAFSGANITVLYFATKRSDFDLLLELFCKRFPRELLNIFKSSSLHSGNPLFHSLLTLFGETDEFDVSECVTFLSSIAKKLSKSRSICSNITVSCVTPSEKHHGTGLRPGVYALIFTSLLSVLDTVSADGELSVRLHTDVSCLEVNLSCKLDENADVFGNFSNVAMLSDRLHESGKYLTLASCCATEAGMYLSAKCEGGSITFTFGEKTELFPILEFKARDPERRVAELLSASLAVLASPEFNAVSKEAQETV